MQEASMRTLSLALPQNEFLADVIALSPDNGTLTAGCKDPLGMTDRTRGGLNISENLRRSASGSFCQVLAGDFFEHKDQFSFRICA